MKEEIINKLKIEENKIRKIIKAIEKNKSTDNILMKISGAKKTLSSIRYMILRCYLAEVATKNNFPEKEILKYYNLTN